MYKGTPPPATVWRAIDTWLLIAYEGSVPHEVSAMLNTLRLHDPGAMFESSVFERGVGEPPTRYALRLGNRAYPFMKLVIERLPTRDTWLFTADTHDRHICPAPDDPEHAAFTDLMAHNRALAAKIEDAWRAQGIDTFRGFLDDDLARRREERLSDRAKA